MPSITESSLGLNYGWDYGESGWNQFIYTCSKF